MPSFIEKSYGKVFKVALKAVNPIKKRVIKTECRVHKFINSQSIIILKNDENLDAWVFFNKHIEDLNSGVIWADQDLKSRNHFYNPASERGLYGSSNALKECMAYYIAALTWCSKKDIRKALFFLGASCHLIQDITVPQHVNIKLLKQHRKYEQWVIRTYEIYDRFKCYNMGIYLDTVQEYIDENARVAMNAYNNSKNIRNLEEKFFDITTVILCQAQRSTAGLLNLFYEDMCSMEKKGKKCAIV